MLLDLARGVQGSHTAWMLTAAGTACSPQDDFPRQQPHSAARAGSQWVPGDGSNKAKPLFSALMEELAHWADGAKPLKPPPERPSSKALC